MTLPAARRVSGRWATTRRVMARFERAALTAFSLSKSVRVALAKDQDPGPAIERPREQHPLLLATGERRTHVPDQALVAHRHAFDVVALRETVVLRDEADELATPHSAVRKTLITSRYQREPKETSPKTDRLHQASTTQARLSEKSACIPSFEFIGRAVAADPTLRPRPSLGHMMPAFKDHHSRCSGMRQVARTR